MRKFFFYSFLALVFVCKVVLSDSSLAANQEKPLMVIRFTGGEIDYERSLDKAISMSLHKKPTVAFELVAVTPETPDRKVNKENERDAKFFAEKIADQIKQSGVSPERVHSSMKSDKLAKVNEIQIFVQ